MYEIIYRIPGRRSYTIQDVQLLTEFILHQIINGNYEKAIQVIIQYNICDLNDFKGKKCIAVFDKLIKFIKISSYLEKWSKFKEDAKSNKALDSTIKACIDRFHTNQVKVTTVTCQSPRQLSPIPAVTTDVTRAKPKLKVKQKIEKIEKAEPVEQAEETQKAEEVSMPTPKLKFKRKIAPVEEAEQVVLAEEAEPRKKMVLKRKIQVQA